MNRRARLALLVAVVLVVAGCATSTGGWSAPPATPSPTAGATPLPPGLLPAGRYAQHCTWPRFELDLPDGFRIIAQQPDLFAVVILGSDQRNPSVLSIARPSDTRVLQRVASLVDYQVSEVRPRVVGGHPAREIVVGYIGPDDDASERTKEYLFTLADEPSAAALESGGIAKLISLEIDGTTLVILAATSVDEARSFYEIADGIITSIEFLPSAESEPGACPRRPPIP